MRSRRTDGLLALGVLVAMVVGLIVIGAVGTRGANPFEIRRSTLLTTPTGTKALYTLLDEFDYDVRRHRASLRTVPPEARTLCILSAPVPLGQDEVRGVVSWVEAGGTLVLTLGGDTLSPTATPPTRGAGAARLAHALDVWASGTPLTQYDVRPVGAMPAVVETVRFHGGRALDGPFIARRDFRPLVLGPHGAIAGVLSRGRGRVIAFADDTPFTNRMVRHPDNALMLVRLLTDGGRPGLILFDERHQGYGDDREAIVRLADALGSAGLGWVILQVMLAAGCLLWLGGRRFGAPLPAPRARRRSSVEAAEALGRAYRDARATGLAAATLAAGARRRVAGRVGIPPTLPPARFNELLRRARLDGATDLADALDRADALRDGDPAPLLEEVAADLERAVEAVTGTRG